MPVACCLFRSTLAARRDAFAGGLERIGYAVELQPKRDPGPGDVLLIWNRRGAEDVAATRYERSGATVLVAENGYIGPPGRHKMFAMARSHHNGAGSWPVGGPERWNGLGVDLKPWRSVGSFMLVLPQRGIGPPGVAMPRHWLGDTMQWVSHRTKRRVLLRRHPGQLPDQEPYAALDGAWAAVTWGSGAGIKALAHGVPVFHSMSNWIGAPAALPLSGAVYEQPLTCDAKRLAMFQRLAWAQWSLEEVASGEAFAWLLKS